MSCERTLSRKAVKFLLWISRVKSANQRWSFEDSKWSIWNLPCPACWRLLDFSSLLSNASTFSLASRPQVDAFKWAPTSSIRTYCSKETVGKFEVHWEAWNWSSEASLRVPTSWNEFKWLRNHCGTSRMEVEAKIGQIHKVKVSILSQDD